MPKKNFEFQSADVADMSGSLRKIDWNPEDSQRNQVGIGGGCIGSLRIIQDCQQSLHLRCGEPTR